MSQISTDSYHSYQQNSDLGSIHSHNSFRASETDILNYDSMTDLLFPNWELSSRLNSVSRGVPKFDDFHLLQAGQAGTGSKNQDQSNYYAGEDQFIHPFDELKLNPTMPNPGYHGHHRHKKNRHHHQPHYVNALDDILAQQFSKDCNVAGSSEDAQSHSVFHQILAAHDPNALPTSTLLRCPERPYHLMKTHLTLKLENPANNNNENLVDDLENESSKKLPASPFSPKKHLPSPGKPKEGATTEDAEDENKSIDYIIDVITSYLNTFSEFDFSYFPKLFLWKGKFLQGSSSCLINIHLYKDSKYGCADGFQTDEDYAEPGTFTPPAPSVRKVSLPNVSSPQKILQQQFQQQMQAQQQQQQQQSQQQSQQQVFIIEANRITGDAKPFHEFFKEFKRLLLVHFQGVPTGGRGGGFYDGFRSLTSPAIGGGGYDSNSSSFDQEDYYYHSAPLLGSSNSSMNSPMPPFQYANTFGSAISPRGSAPLPMSPAMLKKDSSSTSICSCLQNTETFQKSIEPILNMTKCIYYEVKLEAAKMLCDISLCEEFYSRADLKCIDQIFKAIENLILHNDGFLTVKEQAIVAFASFLGNETINYHSKEIKNRMLKSSILYVLVQLVSNPINENLSYETLQMRRESARILSILASYDAKQLLQTLETQSVTALSLKKWFDSIDYLKDSRMKIYAMKTRDLLSNI